MRAGAVQAVEVLEGGFQMLQRAALGGDVIAPLIRLVAFIAMQRRLRPPSASKSSGREGAAGGKADISWLEAVYMSCQRKIIECLEHLADPHPGALRSPMHHDHATRPCPMYIPTVYTRVCGHCLQLRNSKLCPR